MLREAIIIRLARFPCQLEGPGLGADVQWRWSIWFSVGRVCRSHLSSGPRPVSAEGSTPTSCLKTCSYVRHPGMGERNVPWGGDSPQSTLRPSDNANPLLNVASLVASSFSSPPEAQFCFCIQNQPADRMSARSHRWPTAKSITSVVPAAGGSELISSIMISTYLPDIS